MEKNTTLDELTEANADMVLAEFRIKKAVTAAVGAGASWTEIGAKLGISKQTAHARYNQTVKALSTPEAADDVQGPSVTPSIFSDAPAPAKTKKASKKSDTKAPAQREDALQAQQELIYSGYVNTGMQVIDWKAEPDDAARTKCPYCEQSTHYNTKTGHWYVYRGCTLTGKDWTQHATNQDGATA